MNCNAVDLSTPALWVFFSALFFGFSLNRLTVNPAKNTFPERAKTVKWVLFCVYLSVAVLFALIGLLVSGPEFFLTLPVLYYFLGITGVSFFGSKFKKNAGIAVLMAILIFSFMFLSFLSFWDCKDSREQIVQLRLLTPDSSSHRLVLYDGSKSYFYTLDSKTVAAKIETISISPFYLFGTKWQLYIFKGFVLYSADKERPLGELPVPEINGVEDNRWFNFLHATLNSLPGIATTVSFGEAHTLVPLQKYALSMENKSNFIIEPVVE
jgi:hypothetical protein